MLHMISIIFVLVPLAMTGPTIYKLDKEENTAERVMVPVSSTGVIMENIINFGISRNISDYFISF